MRLTTGTGILMIAGGAVLAFAVDPPSVVVRYVDVIDLGLIFIWIGVLVLALQVYMYGPRKSRSARSSRRPFARSGTKHDDRYAPGRFASPRDETSYSYDEQQYPSQQYSAQGGHYVDYGPTRQYTQAVSPPPPPPPAPQPAPQPAPPPPPDRRAARGRPADEQTQYFPREER